MEGQPLLMSRQQWSTDGESKRSPPRCRHSYRIVSVFAVALVLTVLPVFVFILYQQPINDRGDHDDHRTTANYVSDFAQEWQIQGGEVISTTPNSVSKEQAQFPDRYQVPDVVFQACRRRAFHSCNYVARVTQTYNTYSESSNSGGAGTNHRVMPNRYPHLLRLMSQYWIAPQVYAIAKRNCSETKEMNYLWEPPRLPPILSNHLFVFDLTRVVSLPLPLPPTAVDALGALGAQGQVEEDEEEEEVQQTQEARVRTSARSSPPSSSSSLSPSSSPSPSLPSLPSPSLTPTPECALLFIIMEQLTTMMSLHTACTADEVIIDRASQAVTDIQRHNMTHDMKRIMTQYADWCHALEIQVAIMHRLGVSHGGIRTHDILVARLSDAIYNEYGPSSPFSSTKTFSQLVVAELVTPSPVRTQVRLLHFERAQWRRDVSTTVWEQSVANDLADVSAVCQRTKLVRDKAHKIKSRFDSRVTSDK